MKVINKLLDKVTESLSGHEHITNHGFRKEYVDDDNTTYFTHNDGHEIHHDLKDNVYHLVHGKHDISLSIHQEKDLPHAIKLLKSYEG